MDGNQKGIKMLVSSHPVITPGHFHSYQRGGEPAGQNVIVDISWLLAQKIDPLVEQITPHSTEPLITKGFFSCCSWYSCCNLSLCLSMLAFIPIISSDFLLIRHSFFPLSMILSDDVSVLLQEIIVEARNLSGAEM